MGEVEFLERQLIFLSGRALGRLQNLAQGLGRVPLQRDPFVAAIEAETFEAPLDLFDFLAQLPNFGDQLRGAFFLRQLRYHLVLYPVVEIAIRFEFRLGTFFRLNKHAREDVTLLLVEWLYFHGCSLDVPFAPQHNPVGATTP